MILFILKETIILPKQNSGKKKEKMESVIFIGFLNIFAKGTV